MHRPWRPSRSRGHASRPSAVHAASPALVSEPRAPEDRERRRALRAARGCCSRKQAAARLRGPLGGDPPPSLRPGAGGRRRRGARGVPGARRWGVGSTSISPSGWKERPWAGTVREGAIRTSVAGLTPLAAMPAGWLAMLGWGAGREAHTPGVRAIEGEFAPPIARRHLDGWRLAPPTSHHHSLP